MKSCILKNIVTIMIVSGLLLFPLIAQAAGSVVYEQAPGHFGGFSSDGQVLVVADEFQFDHSTVITTITWWGGYVNVPRFPVPSTDNFTVSLYADNSGQPGALLKVFNVGNNVSRTPTGDWVLRPSPEHDFEGCPEFQYSFNLPTAFMARANRLYWLSIVNVPSRDDWMWEDSSSPLHPGIQRSFQSGPWKPYDIPTVNVTFRLQEDEGTPPPLSVKIDILPGIFPNRINIKGIGTIPVAILSSPSFNAPNQVVKSSLTFGRTGDEQSFSCCFTSPEDVNGDGLLDLVGRFSIPLTVFQLTDTTGTLKGMTVDGRSLSGTDSVSLYVSP